MLGPGPWDRLGEAKPEGPKALSPEVNRLMELLHDLEERQSTQSGSQPSKEAQRLEEELEELEDELESELEPEVSST